MAHPFMPMKARKLRKLTRRRKDSGLTVTVFNRPVEFETPVADPHRNKTSPLPAVIAKIVTDKIISHPWLTAMGESGNVTF
jgi:hypothetical protein